MDDPRTPDASHQNPKLYSTTINDPGRLHIDHGSNLFLICLLFTFFVHSMLASRGLSEAYNAAVEISHQIDHLLNVKPKT